MKSVRVRFLTVIFFQLMMVIFTGAAQENSGAKDKNLPEGCKIIYAEIPYGQTTLLATFYCFNDLETGQKVAEIVYKPMDLKAELKKGGFKKLIPVPVGAGFTAWNYSIMSYGMEFWFFENRDDGWLWGTGRY